MERFHHFLVHQCNNLSRPIAPKNGFCLKSNYGGQWSGDLFEEYSQTQGTYYDLLLNNAFGGYRKLLLDVSLSPTMGLFLSHYGNPKENPELNIHPDENYAREIMQLFSIGLWELNQNGTHKYDANGNYIPTYTNADIKDFASARLVNR